MQASSYFGVGAPAPPSHPSFPTEQPADLQPKASSPVPDTPPPSPDSGRGQKVDVHA
jgi:hypothetical protein